MIIGSTAEGKDIKIDLQKLIESRMLLQANSGGGKSWALRRILEQTHGHVQQFILDPEGEFSTLRESFDYVYAAKHGGDTATDPRSAKLLATRLLELGASAILDIYELKPHERIRFVRAFFEAMVDAPKPLWHPVLVVLDEAHNFCPQKGDAESAGAVIDAATRFRKRGYGLILATQRLSKLHKDAAAELNNKLIGRSALDVDMKRASEELGFSSREDQARLRTLRPGEFFCFGPALSDTVTAVHVGAVKSPHPRSGQQAAAVSPPPAKVKKILAQLSDLPQEVEQEARTVADLQGKIRDLTAQLRRAPAPATPRGSDKVAAAAIEARAREQGRREVQKEAEDLTKTFRGLWREARERLLKIGKLAAMEVPAEPLITKHQAPPAPTAPPRPLPKPKLNHLPQGVQSPVSRSQQKVLNALAWLESLGLTPADKTQLALLADQSPTSGGYFNNLGTLRSAGFIEYPAPAKAALTEAGRAIAQTSDVPQTNEDLHRQILAKVSDPQGRILKALIAVYPSDMSKDELAEQTQQRPTSGGYFNNLGFLRSMGVIGYPAPGRAVALPILFLDKN